MDYTQFELRSRRSGMGKLLNQFYVITYSESYSRSNADIPPGGDGLATDGRARDLTRKDTRRGAGDDFRRLIGIFGHLGLRGFLALDVNRRARNVSTISSVLREWSCDTLPLVNSLARSGDDELPVQINTLTLILGTVHGLMRAFSSLLQ